MPRNSPRLSPEKKRHSSIGPSLKKKGLHKTLPQWIFSKGVLQHVPPGELGEFFENLASVMHPETVGVLRAQMGSKNEQTSAKSWLHTIEDLQRAAATLGIDLEINQQEPLRHWLSLRTRRALAACLRFLTALPMFDFDASLGVALALS